MGVDVRPIVAHELGDWMATLRQAFHLDPPSADEVAYRRDVIGQDLQRSLGAIDGGRVVGTLLSFTTELTLPGGSTLLADAVAAATVLPTHRRRRLLTRMLLADMRAARERGDAACILLPAEYPIYGRFGFGLATEQVKITLERAAARFVRSAPGYVELVDAGRMLEIAPPLFERFRRQRPGQIDREWTRWDVRLGVKRPPWAANERLLRCAVHRTPAGEADGYLLYRVESASEARVPTSTLDVVELVAVSPDAYLGLWTYCAEVDLVAHISAAMRPVDEPLTWLLEDARAALPRTQRGDLLWLRPLDTPATLGQRRYASEGRLVLEVSDPLEMCGGRFALEGGPQGATCRATDASAELAMSMQALGSITLGGVSLHVLAEAGLIDELRPGALDVGERMFRSALAPWCSTFF